MKQLFDVLIVEDNIIDQKVLSDYLQEYDITYLMADSGEEAKTMLESLSFKLILLDIGLPGIDAYQLTEIIRQEMKINVPIVAVTNYGIDEVKNKCFAVGMNGCFSKPIGRVELVGMLTQFLPKEKLTSDNNLSFEMINLSYLKEVSLGDLDYEIEIAEKFIETITYDLTALQASFKANDREKLIGAAHRTLSTIYIMGLKSKLEEALLAIENNDLPTKELESKLNYVCNVCQKAIIETRDFIDALKA